MFTSTFLTSNKRTVAIVKFALVAVAMLVAHLASAQLPLEQTRARLERGRLPAPAIIFDELLGVHEADLPQRIGIPTPKVKMRLECSGNSCRLTLGDSTELYPALGTVQMGLFERTERSVAQRFAGAKLQGCLNLAGDDMPDGPFACKVDGMPDSQQSVLLVPPGPPGGEILLYRKR
jgi:hypothetical protein